MPTDEWYKAGAWMHRSLYAHGWAVSSGRMDAQERIYSGMNGIKRVHGCTGADMLKHELSRARIRNCTGAYAPTDKEHLSKTAKKPHSKRDKNHPQLQNTQNNSYIHKTLRIK